jgi:hypothetical protein
MVATCRAARTGVECRLNAPAALDRGVSMQDLRQNFRIRDESGALRDQRFEPALGVHFVRVRDADQVQRDAGIDEDHQ